MKTLTCFGKGFHFSQDGPGNRLVIHLLGCNMRCPWCSNPEGMDASRRGSDVTVVTTDDLLDEIVSCRPMFFGGGGVTFTGGEATLQFDALAELLGRLRAAGIHTALETNATNPRLPELFPRLSLLIADFKHPDGDTLRAVTGADVSVIRKNLRTAAEKLPLLLRIPLIHGFNDDEAAEEGFLSFFQTMPDTDWQLEILPYHEYGREKWEKLGLTYAVKNGFVPSERVKSIKTRFRAEGIRVTET